MTPTDETDRMTGKGAAGRKAARGWFYSRLRRPVAFYLVFLLLVSIVPPFIFASVVLQRTYDAQEHIFTSLLQSSTSSINRIVEREIVGMMTTLRVLSASEAWEKRDFAAFHARASKALANSGSYLILTDENFTQLLNTRVPYGTPLTKKSDPGSAVAAFTTQDPTVSGIFFGNTAQKWVYNVYLPIRIAPDIRYLLILTQNAERMNKAVTREMLSANWNAALLDGKGNVIVSTDPAEAVGTPFFMPAVPVLGDGVHDMQIGETTYRVVTNLSAVTGWKIVAWAKAADTDAMQFNSFLWLSAGAAIFAIVWICGAVAIARVLSDSVVMLARDAHRLGAGEQLSPRRHPITEIEIVSAALAQASRERAKAENEIRFLMREVAHRSKNQLSVILGMLNQSAGADQKRSAFVDAFRKRITGLARSTDLMIDNAAQGVDLQELAENQLKPFKPHESGRVGIGGPPLRLNAQAAQMIGMALHELATNAAKYGALANGHGTVRLHWSLSDDQVHMRWSEHGADLTLDHLSSTHKGFGSVVLERMLGMALDAKLERRIQAHGIEWHIVMPLRRLCSSLAPEA